MNPNDNPSTAPDVSTDVDAKQAIRQYLVALKSSGVDSLPKGTGQFRAASAGHEETDDLSESASIAKFTREQTQPTHRESVAESRPARYTQSNLVADSYGPKLSLEQRKSELEVLNNTVCRCQRCPELVSNRTQTVFGVGNLTPRLVFIGEGPGADEDRTGEPFVGAAGKLLDKIISACQLSRKEVYILNTVKCRPPGNRNPSPSELENCWEYADRQLEILQPEFICCLGSVAAKRILNSTQSLGRLRRQFHEFRGSRVIVTYHPAYLLRTESAKKHVWEDMKMLMKEMGVDLSK